MRRGIWAALVCIATIAPFTALQGSAAEAAPKSKPRPAPQIVKRAVEQKPGSVQLVTFPDAQWNSVKVVRGRPPAKEEDTQAPPTEKRESAEIVSFGDLRSKPVRVVRGETNLAAAMAPPARANGASTQTIIFADLRSQPVTVIRGSTSSLTDIELFAPARGADLDRVAFAVDGAESSHGTDPRMWLGEPAGPQGPMQVSAAAAADIGGGDRFDLTQNRLLGRAYLARMYRRYGNWADAIAAYNWGPGNMDAWIGLGRPPSQFPLAVERYLRRVLRDVSFQ